MRSSARTALGGVLNGARTVALVNFPNHGNPGDPAIWLGTRRLLSELGVKVGYSSAWWDFNAEGLRAAVGGAPVLLNGGGNFGDLYAGQQGTRLEVLRGLPSNRIVQLPQSIHFKDPINESAMAQVIASHGGVQLMVREHKSFAVARDRLGVSPVLSADHAFGMGPQARTRAPTVPILWLARMPGDPEYVDYTEPIGSDVRRLEWLQGIPEHERTWDARGRLVLRLNERVHANWKPGIRAPRIQHAIVARTYAPLAHRWVRRGVDILSEAEVVVTDKLHGHVLCVLLGIPHVVLDNSYGKVSGTLDAWTGTLPGVHRAADGEEALALARDLVRAGRST